MINLCWTNGIIHCPCDLKISFVISCRIDTNEYYLVKCGKQYLAAMVLYEVTDPSERGDTDGKVYGVQHLKATSNKAKSELLHVKSDIQKWYFDEDFQRSFYKFAQLQTFTKNYQ